MPNNEYQELIAFVDRKFDEVDQRFGAMEAKIEETRRHMGVLVEAVRHEVRQVAEGVANVEQRLDRVEKKVDAGFTETRAAIHFSYAQLERRIHELEDNYALLNERVARLESRTA